MLRKIEGLPDKVVGFEATGVVTGVDYEALLIPAVEDALTRHDRIRCFYHIGAGFEKFDALAIWDDAKVGLQHRKEWERVAIVTDVGWIRAVMKTFAVVIPGEMRLFADDEYDAARKWICGE